MYNLSRTEFVEAITATSAVSADGYEVGNLISTDPKQRSRGFRAERFIRPPVLLSLRFRHEVAVHSLLIRSSSQETTFEVWMQKKIPGTEAKGAFRVESTKLHEDPTWILGAKFNLLPKAVARILNCQFNSCGQDNSSNETPRGSFLGVTGNGEETKCSLRRGSFWLSAQTLAIRIVYVKGSMAPALDALEIHGRPLAKQWGTINLVKDAHIEGNSDLDTPVDKDMITLDKDISRIPSASASNDDSTPVPEEFLDELTHEVMRQPIVLPSGHVVDVSTVERHTSAEAAWCRPPSDPFTGLPFTEKRRPVSSPCLKSRIDGFLLKNPVHDPGKRLSGVWEPKWPERSRLVCNGSRKRPSTPEGLGSKLPKVVCYQGP